MSFDFFLNGSPKNSVLIQTPAYIKIYNFLKIFNKQQTIFGSYFCKFCTCKYFIYPTLHNSVNNTYLSAMALITQWISCLIATHSMVEAWKSKGAWREVLAKLTEIVEAELVITFK